MKTIDRIKDRISNFEIFIERNNEQIRFHTIEDFNENEIRRLSIEIEKFNIVIKQLKWVLDEPV